MVVRRVCAVWGVRGVRTWWSEGGLVCGCGDKVAVSAVGERNIRIRKASLRTEEVERRRCITSKTEECKL